MLSSGACVACSRLYAWFKYVHVSVRNAAATNRRAAPAPATVPLRNDATVGVATGDQPETIYMVTSGTHYNNKCCFDYGNAEIHPGDDGPGTMEAVSWTNGTWVSGIREV